MRKQDASFEGVVDPKSDMETINTELILADLETLERAIPRFEKELKGKKIDPSVLAAAKEAQEVLQKGTPLSAASVDLEPIKELGLLTAKPFIYVFNVDEAVLTDAAKKAELAALVAPAEAVQETSGTLTHTLKRNSTTSPSFMT